MKNSEVIMMLLAAAVVVGLGLVLTRKADAATGVPNAGTSGSPDQNWTVEIPNNALPGQPGWAWRYYSNGTAIDPEGRYYFNGVRVS